MSKKNRLDRRDFLKKSAIGAAGLSLLAETTAKASANEALVLPESISQRRIIPLNHHWLYSEKSSPEALQPGFNDRGFAHVNLPHQQNAARERL